MSKPIVLYKKRDFSQKMNVTIDYIRANFKDLIKPLLVVVIPGGILFSLGMSSYMSSIGGLAGRPDISDTEAMGAVGSMGSSFLLMSVVSIVVYSIVLSTIFGYIKRKDAGESLEYMDVLKYGFKYFLPVLGYMFLMMLVSIPAMLFFIIPGVYLMVTLTVGLPAIIFEDISVGAAFSKSFKLIKNKWWSSFGLLMITSLIAGVISYIFIIPTYAIMVTDMFKAVQENPNDPSAVFQSFTSWYGSLTWALAMIGQQITYIIPFIALAFQYFNLSERLEGTGLKSQIEEFENLA